MASLVTSQSILHPIPLQSPNPGPRRFLSISPNPKHPILAARVSCSSAGVPTESPIGDRTRTVCSVALSKWIQTALKSGPIPQEVASLRSLESNLVCTAGPLFFAAKGMNMSTTTATPLTVVAAGMAKWLDIYSGVLMMRVLLSWFPNIPWDRQPLSAIRDLCDPYLNLFRNVVPPLFKSLDVSPLLAFAILGMLSSLLTSGAAA